MLSEKPYNENEILHRVRNHDREAFEQIYRHYQSQLRLFVLKYVKSFQRAEDIVQDAFLKIWEGREHIDPEKNFPGYLWTITKNLVFKFLKETAHNADRVEEIIMDGTITGDIRLESKELQNEIRKAILQLPERRREIFLLCKEENLSYDEVSQKLGISRNTIKEHMVLSLRYLRGYLKDRSLYFIFLVIAFIVL